MNFSPWWVLAIVQALTEYLPVSSSAHLILCRHWMGWPDQGLLFDVLLHLGTFLAASVYFAPTWWPMCAAWYRKAHTPLAWHTTDLGRLAVITLPVVVAGFVLHDWLEAHTRDPSWIAVMTLVFGGLLAWVHGRTQNTPAYSTLSQLSLRALLLVGVCQSLALIPGASRSGCTLMALLLVGFRGEQAARWSMIVGLPALFAASTYGLLKSLQSSTFVWPEALMAVGLVTFVALGGIHFFLKWVARWGLWPFVIYRLFLGGVLLQLTWVD